MILFNNFLRKMLKFTPAALFIAFFLKECLVERGKSSDPTPIFIILLTYFHYKN